MASTHVHQLRSWLSSLRARLIGLVLVALVPAFGLLIYSSIEQRRNDEAAARADAQRLTEVVATQQNDVVQNAQGLLGTLSGLTAAANLETVNASQCSPVFANVLKQFASFDDLGLSKPNGDVVCAATPLNGQVSLEGQSFFKRALESGKFASGDYEFNPVTGRSSLNFGYPVLDQTGQPKAVYFASLDLTWLAALVSSVKLPNGAVINVIDRNGSVVASFPEGAGAVGRNVADSPLGKAILAARQGVSQLPGVDGTERLYSFAPLSDAVDSPAYVSIGLSTSDAFASANRTLARNLSFLGVVALLALSAAWFGGDWVIRRPVNALSRAANRLAKGELSARAGQGHGAGELAELARSFDEMAEALQVKEIERQRANDALTENVAELARSNGDLEAFTYTVSHDLKEPLRTLEAFSQFLIEDYRDQLDDQGREYLGKLANASARMKHLIEDLLSLSRIGRPIDPPAPVDIRRTVLGIVDGMRATVEECGATIEIDEHLPWVLADPMRVEQIFGNLIGNGIKFNQSREPKVTVGTRQQTDGAIAFFVKDNGIGIECQYHERVFGIFQRLHRREEYDGTGAGLAIVKRAAESLGGRVWIESEPGKGTTFLIALPIADSSENTERIAA